MSFIGLRSAYQLLDVYEGSCIQREVVYKRRTFRKVGRTFSMYHFASRAVPAQATGSLEDVYKKWQHRGKIGNVKIIKLVN